jgi:hypothetical protein
MTGSTFPPYRITQIMAETRGESRSPVKIWSKRIHARAVSGYPVDLPSEGKRCVATDLVEGGESGALGRLSSDRVPVDARLIAGGAAIAASFVLAAGLWVSLHVQIDPAVRTAVLFVHLSSLVVGLGAVLVTDYHAMLWLAGRCSLREVGASAERLHLLIWLGLVGLVLSGFLLKPDLNSTITIVKLALVLVLTINGLQVRFLSRRIAAASQRQMSRLEAAWGAASGLISQICWWGAAFIGFWNQQH